MTPLIPISVLLHVSFVLTIYLGINVQKLLFPSKYIEHENEHLKFN